MTRTGAGASGGGTGTAHSVTESSSRGTRAPLDARVGERVRAGSPGARLVRGGGPRHVRHLVRRREGERHDRARRSRGAVRVLGALERGLGPPLYTGDRFPAGKGNVFVGAMFEGRTRGTRHLQRITINEKGYPIQREPILTELRQRIRDVRQGPDGFLYVLTDDDNGMLLRLEPAGPGQS